MCCVNLSCAQSFDVVMSMRLCVAVYLQGFLPTLTCAVFCKTHENIILLPLGFYSFYLQEKKDTERERERSCQF